MATYQYAAFEAEPTDELRLAMLRLYLAELQVANPPTARIGSGNKNRDPSPISIDMVELRKRLRELENAVGTGSRASGLIHADFR